jgi:hypothetical protein
MIENAASHRLDFQLGEQFMEAKWTKRYTLERLGLVDISLLATPQIVGTAFGIQKSPQNEMFVEDFAANLQNYHLISDEALTPNPPDFCEHRHDQSVWSVMNKLTDPAPVILHDETYFPDNWDNKYPYHARRMRF